MLRPVYGPVWESHPKSMSHTMKKLKITELEAEKGDAKMTLVPCIMALTSVFFELFSTFLGSGVSKNLFGN